MSREQDHGLPPLSVLLAWQRRGSAFGDALSAAGGWDALAANAATPSQAAAAIAQADKIVMADFSVLMAVLDAEDNAALEAPPTSAPPIPRSLPGSWGAARTAQPLAGSWGGLR
jgi:hypothetical protein